MPPPRTSRPYMPGYGTLGPLKGTGLLPWSWAEQRLNASRNYWLSTISRDGQPHCMPVWGLWIDTSFWFSSSIGSRKARNLRGNPRCVVATENPEEPVVVSGHAELVTDMGFIKKVLRAENEKYGTEIGLEMFDPTVNSTFKVIPEWVFGLVEADFTGSPTRWDFE